MMGGAWIVNRARLSSLPKQEPQWYHLKCFCTAFLNTPKKFPLILGAIYRSKAESSRGDSPFYWSSSGLESSDSKVNESNRWVSSFYSSP